MKCPRCQADDVLIKPIYKDNAKHKVAVDAGEKTTQWECRGCGYTERWSERDKEMPRDS